MGRHFYIDGDLVATTGDLYTRRIFSGGSCHPKNSVELPVVDGRFAVTEDMGSIFDTYYVRGSVAAGGILGQSKGAIAAYYDIYEFTIKEYEKGLALIKSMFDLDIPEINRDLYLQQLYVSVFGLMEHFLSCSFVRQTCNREESYFKVIQSHLLQQRYGQKDILNGPDCLEKELCYINLANKVIFHNQKAVKGLFQAAFDINVDLSIVETELRVRNDIIHRFGHSVFGSAITTTEEDIEALIAKIDLIVRSLAKQLLALPEV